MSPRAKKEPPKRGPGRPSLNPDGGESVSLTIRIAEPHYVELRRRMALGLGGNFSDAIRVLIEESAARA